METSNAAYDLASEREEQEREAAIQAARAILVTVGADTCVECDRPIPAGRRAAAPFAVRCIECQKIHEEEKYHR